MLYNLNEYGILTKKKLDFKNNYNYCIPFTPGWFNPSVLFTVTIMNLDTPLETLGRGYKMQASKLAKLGIISVQDLLYHVPSRYEDLRLISPINNVEIGETVTIQGTVVTFKNEYRSRHFTIQKAVVQDKTGEIECRWFNQPFLSRVIFPDSKIAISGSVEKYGKNLSLNVKEYEVLETDDSAHIHTGRLVPVYPLTRGLTSKWLRTKIFEILANLENKIEDLLPEELLAKNSYPSAAESLSKIHFPEGFDDAALARQRLSYEELFLLQLGSKVRRQEWQKKQSSPAFHVLNHKIKIEEFFEKLPFTLTGAQLKAIDEILADLATTIPMNRLLEGDVGSGKTVVAAVAIYVAYLNAHQSVFMAPTEILANQHYETLAKLFEPLDIKVALVTRNSTINHKLSTINVLVGTHALLNSKIELPKLGLVIIDEQQRFGVKQRGVLRKKGISPHFLTMTATPIPRTVFLTVYGDLALSLLDEMPKGRIRVKTWLVPEEKRAAGYEWIKKKINEVDSNGNNNQVFIVCPFIEESENATTVKAATKEFEHLSSKIFKDFHVGLLHGKMKVKEKNEVLEKFASGKLDILVATPVVEVGIDIPNATIMVIEAAERFGLSQLHQLRGRVGRRKRESFCLLYTDSPSVETITRLKSLEHIYVGAELAELDLKLRGAGNIYGTAQHGAHGLKIASFSDTSLLIKSKNDSGEIFKTLDLYPKLIKRIEQQESHLILPD